jgi:hypothetical protein
MGLLAWSHQLGIECNSVELEIIFTEVKIWESSDIDDQIWMKYLG